MVYVAIVIIYLISLSALFLFILIDVTFKDFYNRSMLNIRPSSAKFLWVYYKQDIVTL